MLRTRTAGSLRASDIGQVVTLTGWVDRRRDHGGVAFIDLRDASGIQAAGPGAEPTGFPIIGTSILMLSMILVVLSVLVAVNRRRMATYQRRRAMV